MVAVVQLVYLINVVGNPAISQGFDGLDADCQLKKHQNNSN